VVVKVTTILEKWNDELLSQAIFQF